MHEIKITKTQLCPSVSTGVICGLGPYGYIIAMQTIAKTLNIIPNSVPKAISVGPV
jgi:3-dehydroquinate dehydratase